MSTYELDIQKEIFSKNLKRFLERADKNQTDLQKYMKVSSSTVSYWMNGIKMPRMDKIQSICNWLGIQKSDLLEEKAEGYYLDPETAKKAQELFDDPNMRILFDAARDARPEDLQKAADYLKAVKAMELNLDNEGC